MSSNYCHLNDWDQHIPGDVKALFFSARNDPYGPPHDCICMRFSSQARNREENAGEKKRRPGVDSEVHTNTQDGYGDGATPTAN